MSFAGGCSLSECDCRHPFAHVICRHRAPHEPFDFVRPERRRGPGSTVPPTDILAPHARSFARGQGNEPGFLLRTSEPPTTPVILNAPMKAPWARTHGSPSTDILTPHARPFVGRISKHPGRCPRRRAKGMDPARRVGHRPDSRSAPRAGRAKSYVFYNVKWFPPATFLLQCTRIRAPFGWQAPRAAEGAAVGFCGRTGGPPAQVGCPAMC